ncbi:hypothetical protein [Nocardioides luteus]|uniref:hypothetical protein n=1 Tax=Nocardioides luteus TaxID=1844 RepID=UPI0018C91935|nr:hypothetical protein [Nocardioides luteus]MBG6095293.1 hypothetical protein [Nocardioides luteus]
MQCDVLSGEYLNSLTGVSDLHDEKTDVAVGSMDCVWRDPASDRWVVRAIVRQLDGAERSKAEAMVADEKVDLEGEAVDVPALAELGPGYVEHWSSDGSQDEFKAVVVANSYLLRVSYRPSDAKLSDAATAVVDMAATLSGDLPKVEAASPTSQGSYGTDGSGDAAVTASSDLSSRLG